MGEVCGARDKRPIVIRRLFVLLVLFVGLGMAFPIAALDPDRLVTQYVHQAWGVEDGLPQSTVQAVLQSHEGYLWIATQEGLARFDGVRFQVFDRKNTPGIRNDFFTSLAEEPSGALWIGSLGGLVRYASGSFTTFTAQDGLPGDDVRALAVDTAGRVWAGTRSGLARWNGSRFETVGASGHADGSRVQALWANRDGSVWVGSDHGLARVVAGSIQSLGGVLEKESVLCIRGDTRRLAPRGNPAGWAVSNSRQATSRIVPAETLGGHPVFAILRDRSGMLWVGTVGGGLLRLQDKSAAVFELEGGEGENGVRTLLEDREGNIWISTVTGGLVRLHDGPFRSYSSQEGLPPQSAQAVLEDRLGNIWVASSGSLSRMGRDGGPIRTFFERDGVPAGPVISLHEDRVGRLWVASQSGGFAIFEDGRFRPAPPGYPAFAVLAMAEDAEGKLWIGTDGGGIACLDAGVWKSFTARDGLASDSVHDIAFAGDGALWAASFAGGLSRYHDGRFTTIGGGSDLAKAQILSLHADGDGSMWAGTLGKGLFHVDTGGHVTSVTTETGLSDDVVYSILEDDAGYLWTSNNHGVGRLKKKDFLDVAAGRARRLECSAYGRSEGLRFGECSGGSQPAAWKGRDGRLWFVIRRGVAVVDPAAVASSPVARPPDVIAEELLVDRRSHSRENAMDDRTGPHRPRDSFHGAEHGARDDTFSSEADGLRSRLGGSRSAPCGLLHEPRARDLPIRSRGPYRPGPWGAGRTLFEIRVPPRFYQRKLFWFAAAAIGLGLAGAFYRGRVEALRRREAELTRRVEEEMARIKILRGLLPICASCKKIRDDKGYWNQIESYIDTHSEAEFSHGICPDCMKRLYPEYADEPGPGRS